MGAPTASACLYLGGHIFGETGPGPLRSVESHPAVLTGSEVGPGGVSYNSVMLPRSFICILSCPLFPVICFPSQVWRQIYPSNLQNIFCFSFVKSLVLFLHPLTSFAQKTTFAFPSACFPPSHPSFKPSFSTSQLHKQVTVLFFPR